MTARIERLLAHASASGLHAVAVVPGPNMVYLTGLHFHLSERPVVAILPTTGDPTLVLPALEASKAAAGPIAFEPFAYDDVAGPGQAFEGALAAVDMADKWLGIEGRRMRFLELDAMSRTDHRPRIFAAEEVFAELRMRKDAAELAHMRRAVEIAEQALAATLSAVRAGSTEQEIASELTLQLLRAGSEPALPFTPIVAAGQNGANPHAFPTDYALRPGDLVTLDWGATHQGYFSDITRTFAVAGAPVDPELERAYEVVRAANAAGRAAARPAATGQDVDRATRGVVDAAGLGQFFVHRTGHGLGLEGHEEPDMNEGSLVPLEPGMTFTVEPGVYIPGRGGVRIEDDVAVTADGSESLTTLPRALETVG